MSVRRVWSATAVDSAVLWIEFDWGQHILRARQTPNRASYVSGTGIPLRPIDDGTRGA